MLIVEEMRDDMLLTSSYQKAMIESYILNYGNLDADIDLSPSVIINVNNILREWNRQKSKYLYDLLGKQLIFSKDIKIEITENECREKMSYLRNEDEFCKKLFYAPKIKGLFHKEIPYYLRSLISDYSLYHNRCRVKEKFELPNGEILKVEPQTKLMNALRKVASAYGWEQEFEEFRIKHSQIFNTKQAFGRLTLSIHPLDYMTMSDNDNCWSSCMSWAENGSYRAGTVEMMNSPCVVVAFLESSDFLHFDTYRWNSKKWRQLFIVTPEIISGVKAYPYANDKLTLTILNILKELAVENLNWTQYAQEELVYLTPYLYFPHHGVEKMFNPDTEYMYNDFHSISEKIPAYVSEDSRGIIDVNYSGVLTCIYCGEEFWDSDCDLTKLGCEDCLERKLVERCQHCGREMRVEDIYYTADDAHLCSECFEEEVKYCVDSNDFRWTQNCYQIAVIRKVEKEEEETFFNDNLPDGKYRFIQDIYVNNPYSERTSQYLLEHYSNDKLIALTPFWNWKAIIVDF